MDGEVLANRKPDANPVSKLSDFGGARFLEVHYQIARSFGFEFD